MWSAIVIKNISRVVESTVTVFGTAFVQCKLTQSCQLLPQKKKQDEDDAFGEDQHASFMDTIAATRAAQDQAAKRMEDAMMNQLVGIAFCRPHFFLCPPIFHALNLPRAQQLCTCLFVSLHTALTVLGCGIW